MCSTQYRTLEHVSLLHLPTPSVLTDSHPAVISNTCRYRLDTDKETCDTSIPTLISPGTFWPDDEMDVGSEEDVTHPHTHTHTNIYTCVRTHIQTHKLMGAHTFSHMTHHLHKHSCLCVDAIRICDGTTT